MKVGISMWSYFHAWKNKQIDVAGFIHEAKKQGADGVELLTFFYKDLDRDRERTQQALEETGLECGVFSVGNNFVKPDPFDRMNQVEEVMHGVNEALLFGAKVVRVFAGNTVDGIPFEEAKGWIIDGLSEASKYAYENGIQLALENHGKLAGRSDQVRDIVMAVRDRIGNDTLGANPDTGNFLLVGQKSEEALEDVASLAYMVHFKDFTWVPDKYQGQAYDALNGSRYAGTAIGEGQVKLSECVEALDNAGFNGWLNIEYEGEEDPFTAIPRSIRNTRKFIEIA